MPIKIKQVHEWKRILIDTSILISLFNSEKSDITDDKLLFVRKLIDYLSNTKSEKDDRIFLISTITIAELLTKEQDSDKIKKILKALNSNNVEFIDFNLETSLLFNRFLYPKLSKGELHRLAKLIGFRTDEFMMAREWISKDFMILSSGIEKGIDVALTLDIKTMYLLSKELNLFCALTYPELFEVFGTAVTKYNYDKVEELIDKHTTTKKEEIPIKKDDKVKVPIIPLVKK